MMTNLNYASRALAAAALCIGLAQAQAAVVITSIGTGAPPTTLGGFAMTPFPNDGIINVPTISTLPTPIGGTLGFSPSVQARDIGSTWGTWSHGYTGDVYSLLTGAPLVITLPSLTDAFYLYVEPNNFALFDVTVTDQEGDPVTQSVNGSSGSYGFGFHGTGGTQISSITVSAVQGAAGFAVGEFGIARSERQPIPEPTPLALMALAALGLAATRRRQAKAD